MMKLRIEVTRNGQTEIVSDKGIYSDGDSQYNHYYADETITVLSGDTIKISVASNDVGITWTKRVFYPVLLGK